ncbi:MAG: hypothetical protein ABIP53_06570 [Candidatus Limnocylindrales bacterium]
MRDTEVKVNRRHVPVALLSLALTAGCGSSGVQILTPPPVVATAPPLSLPTQPAVFPGATFDAPAAAAQRPVPGPAGPTPWPAPAATPAPEGYAPLVGRWTYEDEFISRVLAFLPDGRYLEVTTVGATPLDESGTYAVDGTSLTLSPFGEDAVTYDLAMDGAVLTIVGGGYSSVAQFALEPGSPEGILGEAQEADAIEAQLDAQWRARIPVALMAQQPPHVALDEVPEDPNVANIFGTPTIFVSPELYLEISLAEVTYVDGSTGSVR